jgi:hypothetical protein
MKKFIPYEKMSKKQQREFDKAKRTTWGELSPVTRKSESKKIYNRKRIRNDFDEKPNVPDFILRGSCVC